MEVRGTKMYFSANWTNQQYCSKSTATLHIHQKKIYQQNSEN